MDFPVTAFYWNVNDWFTAFNPTQSRTMELTGYITRRTSENTSEGITTLKLPVEIPLIPGKPTKTNADIEAVLELLNAIPDATVSTSGVGAWRDGYTEDQTIHNIIVSTDEIPTGPGIEILSSSVDAPDPLQGWTVDYTTSTAFILNDKIESGGSAVIIEPAGDIVINAGGDGVILEGPAPTEPNHVVTKKYVDENAPIYLTIDNGPEAPFMELAGFYQERVRTAVERVLQETDGVSIHQFALQSDFINTTLETMTLNELVDLLTHVAIVGR